MATLKFPSDFSIPFNVAFQLDGNLREAPVQPAAMRQAVDWLHRKTRSEGVDNMARARLLSMHGTYSRMLGELDAALASLRAAVQMQTMLRDEKLSFANTLRLAQVHQSRREFADSNALFDVAADAVRSRASLAPFTDCVHQYTGRNLFDQGNYAEALAQFEAALALRERKGDAELVALSRHCIAITRQRMASSA